VAFKGVPQAPILSVSPLRGGLAGSTPSDGLVATLTPLYRKDTVEAVVNDHVTVYSRPVASSRR
jgi:hypothetical protein